jgi:hypothetical protein
MARIIHAHAARRTKICDAQAKFHAPALNLRRPERRRNRQLWRRANGDRTLEDEDKTRDDGNKTSNDGVESANGRVEQAKMNIRCPNMAAERLNMTMKRRNMAAKQLNMMVEQPIFSARRGFAYKIVDELSMLDRIVGAGLVPARSER